MSVPTEKEIHTFYDQLNREAEASGYHLNTDKEFTFDLVKGLLVNIKRYGYQACPCRLASGEKEDDLDIICPCDYRDPDLNEYDMCYCCLYVSQDVVDNKKDIGPIPERRLSAEIRGKKMKKKKEKVFYQLSEPVWRCKVCGYLCARENPPEICPICKAKKDRFEQFM
jgi:ferredoxin-thioredoxin reductase catalytic subunit